MTATTKEIEIPLFSLGTYTPMDGEPVTFDENFLRTLEKNTNYVIAAKALQPPVGYDHPAHNVKDTDAHGHIVRTTYRNGVLFGYLANPSKKLAEDARERRRLAYSPEFHPNFKFTDAGREIPVGPTVVGLAMLGKIRPAMKNPAHVPVAELGFSENVSAADAFMAREELRKAGLVAQTFDEGVYVFSEVDVNPRMFSEPARQEHDMDEKDFERKMEERERKLREEFESKQQEQARQFSEKLTALQSDGARKAEVAKFFEEVTAEKPRVGKRSKEHFMAALNHPVVAANADLDRLIRSGIEALPAAIVAGGRAPENARGFSESDGDPEDPPPSGDENPLDAVTLKHLDHISAPATRRGEKSNAQVVEEALVAFQEKEPGRVKGLSKLAQLTELRKYVKHRDAAAN